MVATSESVLDITGMGTELPMSVTVDAELLAAVRAGESINRFPLHQIQMGIPPLVPAGIRAEPFPLPSRILFNRSIALLTA